MADNSDQHDKKPSEEAAKNTKQGDTMSQHLPPPELSSFMISLASTALMQLGEIPGPVDGEVVFDLTMAKHSIDIIAMLLGKLRSGLTKEEDKLIEGLLYELQMRYVQKS